MRLETILAFKATAIIAFSSLSIAGFMKIPYQFESSTVLTKTQSSTGRQLFLDNCARCHGDDAKGDKGPDLTSPKRQSKWSASDDPLVNKINKGGLFMPKFGKKLTPEQIKEIADYVRSLGK